MPKPISSGRPLRTHRVCRFTALCGYGETADSRRVDDSRFDEQLIRGKHFYRVSNFSGLDSRLLPRGAETRRLEKLVWRRENPIGPHTVRVPTTRVCRTVFRTEREKIGAKRAEMSVARRRVLRITGEDANCAESCGLLGKSLRRVIILWPSVDYDTRTRLFERRDRPRSHGRWHVNIVTKSVFRDGRSYGRIGRFSRARPQRTF